MKYTFYNEEDTKKKLCDYILKSKRLSMGEKCFEFEKKFAQYQGRKYAVMFNSGSSANLALIQSLVNQGLIKKGENIGFSAVTWATNVMPLLQLGLNPIPIDISLETLNVSSKTFLDTLKSKQIKVLFLTNLLGFCSDIDQIVNVCKENNIILVEDNCESFGSIFKDTKLGNFGLGSSFSFYVGHQMSTIEGGMVCTDDEDFHNMILMVRTHGWDRNLNTNKQAKLRKENDINDFYAKYVFYVQGYNLRPSDINAFIGIEQLKFIDEIIQRRLDNFNRLNKVVENNPDFTSLQLDHVKLISNFAYPVICKNNKIFEKYKTLLLKNDVEIRPILSGSMLNQPVFKKYMEKNSFNYECPNAEIIHNLGIYVPNHPDLDEDEIALLENLLKYR
tara:strand:+ start:540 stop:1709 length:1170 start_codon:yes stop_codon:yes gene_type:complete